MFRKLGALLVATALILSMGIVAFGASKVTTIESGVFVSDISFTEGSSTYTVGNQLTSVEGNYSPGEEINIFLDPSKFTGTDVGFTPATGMSARDLQNAGVTFRQTSEKNGNLVKETVFKEKQVNGKQVALLQVKLADTKPTTADSKEFTIKITLYANKVTQQELYIYGTVGSDVITISSGQNYVFLGEGGIAEATDNISAIEVDAGKDVMLSAKLYKGKRYYAVANDNPSEADLELFNKHPELQAVYNLNTEGFLETDVTVKITFPEKMFVYDGNGKYLGTTQEKLGFSNKYYLSDTEITLNTGNTGSSQASDEKEPDSGDEPVPGDIIPDHSGSDIPDTGIGIMPKIAAVAIVVSLIAIGVVFFTGRKRD